MNNGSMMAAYKREIVSRGGTVPTLGENFDMNVAKLQQAWKAALDAVAS